MQKMQQIVRSEILPEQALRISLL